MAIVELAEDLRRRVPVTVELLRCGPRVAGLGRVGRLTGLGGCDLEEVTV